MKIRHKEDYRDLRRQAYPPVHEQLDALWHAMNEEKAPRMEPFFSMVKAVKDRYPKEPK